MAHKANKSNQINRNLYFSAFYAELALTNIFSLLHKNKMAIIHIIQALGYNDIHLLSVWAVIVPRASYCYPLQNQKINKVAFSSSRVVFFLICCYIDLIQQQYPSEVQFGLLPFILVSQEKKYSSRVIQYKMNEIKYVLRFI